MAKLLILAALLCTSPALAEDNTIPPFPKECNGAYVIATLGTVMNSCKNLRVTGQGMVVAMTLQKERPSKECVDRAKSRVMADLLGVMAQQKDLDQAETYRQWCDAAQGALELTFPGYTLVKRR